MQVLKPVKFENFQLISSNAVESTSNWNSLLPYGMGSSVKYGPKVYESLVDDNLGNQPDLSPTLWLLKRSINSLLMFDPQVNTQTSANENLTVKVRPGTAVNSLALTNVIGQMLTIVVKDGLNGPIVYSKTVNLDNSIVLDWYMYFFEGFNPRTEVVFTDIPAYLNSHIEITLTSSGEVRIGNFVYGTVYNLGLTQYGASSGIIDYSVKQTDDFGNTTFIQRAYSKRINANVLMKNSSLALNQRLLSDLRATPVVWIGSQESEYESLVVFGFYREFSIDISYPTYSMCQLSIEGLI